MKKLFRKLRCGMALSEMWRACHELSSTALVLRRYGFEKEAIEVEKANAETKKKIYDLGRAVRGKFNPDYAETLDHLQNG